MSIDFETFRYKFAALVEGTGHTASRVARDMGLPPSTVTRLIVGQRKPNIYTADKIADFFNVPLDWLLGRDESPKNEAQKEADRVALLYMISSDRDKAIVKNILATTQEYFDAGALPDQLTGSSLVSSAIKSMQSRSADKAVEESED